MESNSREAVRPTSVCYFPPGFRRPGASLISASQPPGFPSDLFVVFFRRDSASLHKLGCGACSPVSVKGQSQEHTQGQMAAATTPPHELRSIIRLWNHPAVFGHNNAILNP
ncbi:hypothetical protein P168DRAFT_25644 [Aspergillus campestris IBT 28561]|uniref:Uncharacterized protein n=1 Tax=Aspergillus campestris (strain IBT 28561) TaxID=1392248 RepID=A0A2I1DG78_ASPC2|nr:uncharacterized protein P168DRAFT_25644 [Aspergillus campestris IBT 28561]PKY08877.1 hypothetical protein P168DRAFT_25644 [Aspergillus campestris IBT 28561]